MSTTGDLIVIRTYEQSIPIPTPEVKQPTEFELIDVTVDSNNGYVNGHSVVPGNISPPVILDKSSRTTVQTSGSISTSPNLSNVIPVVIDKPKSSFGVFKPDSTPSKSPTTSPTSTVTMPEETTSTSNSSEKEISVTIKVLYIIACIISSFTLGIDFFDNYYDDDIYWFYAIVNIIVYFCVSYILWKRIIKSTCHSIKYFLITTILLFILKIISSVDDDIQFAIYVALFFVGILSLFVIYIVVLVKCSGSHQSSSHSSSYFPRYRPLPRPRPKRPLNTYRHPYG